MSVKQKICFQRSQHVHVMRFNTPLDWIYWQWLHYCQVLWRISPPQILPSLERLLFLLYDLVENLFHISPCGCLSAEQVWRLTLLHILWPFLLYCCFHLNSGQPFYNTVLALSLEDECMQPSIHPVSQLNLHVPQQIISAHIFIPVCSALLQS